MVFDWAFSIRFVFIFYDIDNEQYVYCLVWFCNLLENVIQIKSKENIYRHFHWNFFSRFLLLFISWFVCLIVWFIYVLQICGYFLWFITTYSSNELRMKTNLVLFISFVFHSLWFYFKSRRKYLPQFLLFSYINWTNRNTLMVSISNFISWLFFFSVFFIVCLNILLPKKTKKNTQVRMLKFNILFSSWTA